MDAQLICVFVFCICKNKNKFSYEVAHIIILINGIITNCSSQYVNVMIGNVWMSYIYDKHPFQY